MIIISNSHELEIINEYFLNLKYLKYILLNTRFLKLASSKAFILALASGCKVLVNLIDTNSWKANRLESSI